MIKNSARVCDGRKNGYEIPDLLPIKTRIVTKIVPGETGRIASTQRGGTFVFSVLFVLNVYTFAYWLLFIFTLFSFYLIKCAPIMYVNCVFRLRCIAPVAAAAAPDAALNIQTNERCLRRYLKSSKQIVSGQQ